MTLRQSAIVAGSLVLVLLATLAPAPIAVRAATIQLPSAIYFPATGQSIRAEFLRFWADRGHIRLLGQPISAEIGSGGGVVQYFEFARLEMTPAWPAAPAFPGKLSVGAIGREALVAAGLDAIPATEPVERGATGPDRSYFTATGHSLAFAFKRFWEANGGLDAFGAPITEEFRDGGATVQYFERARFQYVPERAGEPDEVAMGAIGRVVAARNDASREPGARPADAVEWTPTLAATLEKRLRQKGHETELAAVAEPVAPFQVVIDEPIVPTYWAPTTVADDAGPVYMRHIYLVDGVATGEEIAGDRRWYRLSLDGSYLPAAYVAPFTAPAPLRSWPGRWVDVNLTTFYLTVYEGDTPLRSALITAGRKNRTPLGVFFVQRRVRSETMDSASVGFPPGHPEHYYLKNVEFTQYFTGAGHALHGNYWVHPSRFGQFISNGCIGLRNHDAAWVWALTNVGSPVHIHY